MPAIRIRWSLYQFEASTLPHPPTLIVSRYDQSGTIHARTFSEHDEKEEARQWLGGMGLDARQARRLIDAVTRNEGPYADPRHPRRVPTSLASASEPETATSLPPLAQTQEQAAGR